MTDLFAHDHIIPANFVGRAEARADLAAWLAGERSTIVIHAVGGMGKSTLSRIWVEQDLRGKALRRQNQVDADKIPSRILWWSFYEVGASFRTFLKTFTQWISSDHDHDLDRPENQLGRVLRSLISDFNLIVLDGFERELRAYAPGIAGSTSASSNECTDPLATELLRALLSNTMASRVLMTSRIVPTELGVQSKNIILYALKGLSDSEVISFFQMHEISGSDAELIGISARYGHHPLALKLLAGRLKGAGMRSIDEARNWSISRNLRGKSDHILAKAVEGLDKGGLFALAMLCASPDDLSPYSIACLFQLMPELVSSTHVLSRRGLISERGATLEVHPVVRAFVKDILGIPNECHTIIAGILARGAMIGEFDASDVSLNLRMAYHFSRGGEPKMAVDLLRHAFPKAYYMDGRYEEILESTDGFADGSFMQSLAFSDQTYALSARAVCFERIGQFSKGAEILSRVLEIDHRARNVENIGITSNNLARTLMWLGNLKQAREVFDKMPWESHSSPQVWSRFLLFNGLLGAILGEPNGVSSVHEALKFFQMQHAKLENSSSAQSVAVAYIYATDSLLEAGDFDYALYFADQAVQAAALSGSKREIARSDVTRLSCLVKMGKYKTYDLTEVDAALLLARGTRQPDLEVQALLCKSRFLTLQSNIYDARRVALEALRKSVWSGLRVLATESHLELARHDLYFDRPDDAEFHLSKANEFIFADVEFVIKRLALVTSQIQDEINPASHLSI